MPARPHVRSRRAAAAAALALAAALAGCRTQPEAEARDAARAPAPPGVVVPRSDSAFAAAVARLSEPGGYFDSDNLVSNESSLLHVLSALERQGTQGGAYVGVGPEQNFSYIAAVRPAVAYIIDIRRDNLLQHLWYKVLFEQAANRGEFLLLLTGRPVPADVGTWADLTVDELVARVDAAAPTDASRAAARARVAGRLATLGVPLDDDDRATIARIHDAFIADGLDLRFTSYNRGPRADYPTLRDILGARDREGAQRGFLTSEARFGVVQALQRANAVIPVVGDLAGAHALPAIGAELERDGHAVSVLYASNVEFYLMRAGTFNAFARTAAALPRDERSVIVRSCFGYACGPAHPNVMEGHRSVQVAQTLDAFAAAHEAGALTTYGALVRHAVLAP